MRTGPMTQLLFITLLVLFTNRVPPQLYAGTITGEVVFSDAAPQLPAVKVSKDQDFCGDALPNETYLIHSTGGLKNVVVFVESATSSTLNPHRENILDNTGCRYSPRILAMQRGERLKVRNNDPKLHIPHSYLEQRTVFTLSLPFRGTTIDATARIRQAGVLKVVCDTHAWMLAYIHVFDHPYFAISDERGMFSIPDIPPGAYTLKAWHEDAGLRSQEIVVPETGDLRVGFDFGQK
jgi:hypothetical protein